MKPNTKFIVEQYPNHSFDRATHRLFRSVFGSEREIKPKDGKFELKKFGRVFKLTADDLMMITEFHASQHDRTKKSSIRGKIVGV